MPERFFVRNRAPMWRLTVGVLLGLLVYGCAKPAAQPSHVDSVTYAPEVPPPIARRSPTTIRVALNATVHDEGLAPGTLYRAWTFNDHVPGPFIRAREGDTLEVTITNNDKNGMPHNVDFHAVTGPGGGGLVTTVGAGERRVAEFRLLHPGLFVYHCGVPPVMDHIANGMYGLILVEAKGELPAVARELYVMRSEFYTTDPTHASPYADYSHAAGLREDPRFIVFNGSVGALLGERALRANTGDRIRIYVGNAGPNKIASFHVIGAVFDKVYREGDLLSPPARAIATTMVPAGGTVVVEFVPEVPGGYTLVDHAIFRLEKGAAGLLEVQGQPRPDLYRGR